jgi:hypothetical protein
LPIKSTAASLTDTAYYYSIVLSRERASTNTMQLICLQCREIERRRHVEL